jgi:hypothetical protein
VVDKVVRDPLHTLTLAEDVQKERGDTPADVGRDEWDGKGEANQAATRRTWRRNIVNETTFCRRFPDAVIEDFI